MTDKFDEYLQKEKNKKEGIESNNNKMIASTLQSSSVPSEVILGQKCLKSGAFHAIAHAPSTIIDLGDLFYLEIKTVSNGFSSIELKTRGVGNAKKYRMVTRPKIIKKTEPKKVIPKKKIEVNREVKKIGAW